MKAILDDQKLTFANVVKSTVFLTDLANFAGMNEIIREVFHRKFPGNARRFKSPVYLKARAWRLKSSRIFDLWIARTRSRFESGDMSPHSKKLCPLELNF
ncbi:MAG: Rid family hydrolase [Limisphaerales bacterium]